MAVLRERERAMAVGKWYGEIRKRKRSGCLIDLIIGFI
jgi:hypothetical protein